VVLHGFTWPRPAGTCLLISAVCAEFPPLCPGSMTTTFPLGTAGVDDVDEVAEEEVEAGGADEEATGGGEAGDEGGGAGLASGFPQATANASTAMAARAARGEVGTRTRLVLGAASPT
jgi:hypothetical protein